MSSEQPKILAVITARGGSKGIPGKNVKSLGGKPLIAYTIEAAGKSKLITHTIVSTDYEDIAAVAREWGAEVPFIRPKELAEDQVPHVPVMRHAIEHMEQALGEKFDYAVILQPTSPFRLPEDIDKTLEKLIESSAESAVTLVEIRNDEHPLKAKRLEGDRVLHYAIEEVEGTRARICHRHTAGAVRVCNAARYAHGCRLYGEHIVGHIVPRERSIDIDEPFDWIKAEYMLGDLKRRGFNF